MHPAPARSPRIYRGWWIVAAATSSIAFSVGATMVYTFGIFAKPLAADFKTTRGSIALAASLLDVVVMFSAPFAGRLADRYGARGVIAAAFVALSICLVSLSWVQPPLWHLYALYGLAGVAGVATTPVTYSRVIANWFDRKRGLALGIANAGIGLGTFVTPPLAQFLIDRGGWRLAYQGLAVTCVAISLPIVWFFLQNSPGPTSGGEVPALTEGMTVNEALRTPTFWALCFIFFCVTGCVNGAFLNLAPLMTDAGITARSASFAGSIFGAAFLTGRIGNGYLVDRFHGPRVVAVIFTGAAAALAMLWTGVGVAGAYLAAALLGLASGAEGDVMPYLISRYFGMRSMATLYGFLFGAYTLGNGTGRYLFALGFDATRSYRFPLATAFCVLTVAIALCLTLRKYRTHSPG